MKFTANLAFFDKPIDVAIAILTAMSVLPVPISAEISKLLFAFFVMNSVAAETNLACLGKLSLFEIDIKFSKISLYFSGLSNPVKLGLITSFNSL